MKSITVLKILFMFISLMVMGQGALAAPMCTALFEQRSFTIEETLAPLRKFYDGATAEPMSYAQHETVFLLTHSAALTIAHDKNLMSHADDIVNELELMKERIPISYGRGENYYLSFITQLQLLIKLATGKIDSNGLLQTISDHRFGSYSTAGLILENLPQNLKANYLDILGKLYLGKDKRAVTQPIHVLLNPKLMYQQFKAENRSDRDFFNHYINLVKQTAFSSEAKVGGYKGDLVIKVAEIIQSYLRTKEDMQAVNFFGSVPNGFGTPHSDLDLFNHPIESHYPDLLERKAQGETDPFEMKRYQIDDPVLAQKLNVLTSNTLFPWHLENLGEKAHEHFGAYGHIFSFHITKEKIILRFYPNYIRKTSQGTELKAFDYIELDVTH